MAFTDDKMAVLQINTLDGAGGAAAVARRITDELRARGYSCDMLVGSKQTTACFVHTFDHGINQSTADHCWHNGLLYYEYQGSHQLISHPAVQHAGLLHFHNLHGGYFNPFSLALLSNTKPSIWTLHDMQPLTGHCAHSFGCGRWVTGCHTCPALDTYPGVLTGSTHLLWQHKKAIYDESLLTVVVPSEWLRRKVQCSILSGHPLELICNGVDTDVFRPTAMHKARKALGLPADCFLIGAVADFGPTANPWKGGEYAMRAMEAVWSRWPDAYYLDIGAQRPPLYKRVLSTGRIDDPARLALMLSALDVFLYPSLADTCPLVILEALACAVPIVAFATGGVPELLDDGVEGRVTPYRDEAQLIRALFDTLENSEMRERFRAAGRARALARYRHKAAVDRYEQVYHETIERFERIAASAGERRLSPALTALMLRPVP